MERYPHHEPEDDAGQPASPVRMDGSPSPSRRIATGLKASLPSAVAALFMVGAIAFGAAAVRPAAPDAGHSQEQAAPSVDKPSATVDKPAAPVARFGERISADEGVALVAKPTPEPTPKPEPIVEATPKPTPKPTAKPTLKPVPATLAMELSLKDGKVLVSWSAYVGDGFAYYKVVRSKDATVSWPLGAGDSLAAYINDPSITAFLDGSAPTGITLYYRVFAVRGSETGYAVLAASNVGSIVRPAPVVTPKPEPYAMAFEVTVGADGAHLHWEACGSAGFKYYKIVRSMTNENPLYPLNEGTELIGVISDSGVTDFTDTAVNSGERWVYRVLSAGYVDGTFTVLGQTAAVAVVVP